MNPLNNEQKELLFDYMTRELGESRSALVREHIRLCEKCRAESREIQATLDLLQEDSKAGKDIPDRLSDDRRKRIIRAFMHPVMNWLERHHVIVSIVIALIVIAIVMLIAPKIKVFKKANPDRGVPVNVLPHGPPEKLEEIEKLKTDDEL